MSTVQHHTVDLSPFKNLRFDIPAGLVVALVAIPLCLGVALASGAPLFAGIISGIVGGLIVPFFSRSALSVSGPAAGLTAIVLVAITEMHSFSIFVLAVFLAGLIQITLGFLRAGAIAYFFPAAVIEGMLAAIGLILILKQLPYALGVDIGQFGSEAFTSGGENTFSGVLTALSGVEWGALLISLVALAILIVWERTPALKRQTWFSGPLVAVLAGTLVNLLLLRVAPGLALGTEHLVQLPMIHSPQDLLASLTFPDWHAITNRAVWVTAVTIAIVASLESLLSIEAGDKLDPFKRRTPLDGELVSQGVANSVSGLIGGLPVTAVIVRTSANVAAGGRTQASAFLHGVFLLLAVVFLSTLLNQVPLATLASILLMVGYKLAKPSLVHKMWRLGRTQFLPFVVTVITVLFTDLLIGVGIGLLVGVFFVLKNNFHAAVKIRKEGPAYVIDFHRDVTFVNKATVSHILEHLPPKASVILDGSRVEFIDHDILEIIRDFEQSAKLRDIDIQERGFDRPILQVAV